MQITMQIGGPDVAAQVLGGPDEALGPGGQGKHKIKTGN
jgi:hypothetical protein